MVRDFFAAITSMSWRVSNHCLLIAGQSSLTDFATSVAHQRDAMILEYVKFEIYFAWYNLNDVYSRVFHTFCYMMLWEYCVDANGTTMYVPTIQ